MVCPVMRLEPSGKRPLEGREAAGPPTSTCRPGPGGGRAPVMVLDIGKALAKDGAEPKCASHGGHTSRTGGKTMEPGMLWRGNVLKATAVVALAAWALTGCETVQGSPKTAIGGLGG